MNDSLVVLWLKDLKNEIEGYCVGWRLPIICVASVLHAESKNEAESLLVDSAGHKDSTQSKSCVTSPSVLGYFSKDKETQNFTLKSQDSQLDCRKLQVIYYQRPNLRSMEIYALDFRIYNFTPANGGKQRDTSLSSVLSLDFTRPRASSSRLDVDILGYMNHSAVLHHALHKQTRPYGSISAFVQYSTTHLNGLIAKLSSRLQRISLPRVWGSSTLLEFVRIIDQIMIVIFATAQQLNVRLEQILLMPYQFPRMYHAISSPSSRSISYYVNFWNDIWLIFNDIIIGSAVGSFLCENSNFLANTLHRKLEYWLVEFPLLALVWLNSWPAGLKLNTELSQFYCHTLLGIVAVWGEVLRQAVFPHLSTIIYIIGILGSLGLTMSVSSLSDSLGVMTIHFHACYVLSAAAFSQQLSISGSLWNLFRGKRYNVLRKRKDSWDYDVDQLVLGTILFTLVAFLSPTIITYYTLFALARLIIVLIHAGFDTILVLMNHFPLFALLLRVKNPLRMPGGFTFRINGDDFSPMIEIKSVPFSSIFDHYVYLGSRLASHYHPLRLLRVLLGGGRMSTIPRSYIRLRSVQNRDDKEE